MSAATISLNDNNVISPDQSSQTPRSESYNATSTLSKTPIQSAYILQNSQQTKKPELDEESDVAMLHAQRLSEHEDVLPPPLRDPSASRQTEPDSPSLESITLDPNLIEFYITRTIIVRSYCIPVCVFVGRVCYGRRTEWEIHFRQKQLLQLHFALLWYFIWNKVFHTNSITFSSWLNLAKRLDTSLYSEKSAQQRKQDTSLIQHYIRSLLSDHHIQSAEPLLSFLELSPLRCKTRYGPSLKEGYVHIRINGAFQLPLYKCFNSTIEALYRHLYRTYMRIAFASSVIMFIAPVIFVIITNFPQVLGIKRIQDHEHQSNFVFNGKQFLIGVLSICGILYSIGFVYMFFKHRLGVVRRWIVLKPTCIAAYRRREDVEPNQVFLFDQKFNARKGNYRQGVSYMPSGLVIGSNAGFLELDTGHYYTRITSFIALCLVSYCVILLIPWSFQYKNLPLPNQIPVWRTLNEDVRYCGYYFVAPRDLNVDIKGVNVFLTRLQVKANGELGLNTASSVWLEGNGDITSGTLLAHMVTKGTLIGVFKRLGAKAEAYYPSKTEIYMERIGILQLQGLEATARSRMKPSSMYCNIPIKLAIFRTNVFTRLALLLTLGGIASAAFGILLNYLLTIFGLWHANIRRDHWFQCLHHLQSFRKSTKAFRYHSFAPQHVQNSTPDPATSNNSNRFTHVQESEPSSKYFNGEFASYLHERTIPSSVSWHVDGEDTFEAMYYAIRSAKHEILIAGWWICPDLFLLRPSRKLANVQEMPKEKRTSSDFQLRNLLLLKAQAGVKIYILIYREVKLALTLNSHYTKRSLNVHPNIHVLRDPIFQIQSLGFWSHHEKIVCIDQSLAFVGGLDLCFGRYDHPGHSLADGDNRNPDAHVWMGKDYSNPIIKDFVRVNKPFEDLVDRSSIPRMPWHDVHCSVSGPAAQDVAYHFIQRWNFVCSKNDYQLRTGWCICLRSRRFKDLPKCILPMDYSGWKLYYTDQGHYAPLGEPSNGNEDHSPHAVHSPYHKAEKALASQDYSFIGSKPHPQSHQVHVQVVRSASLWSAGVSTESSIHEAYLDVIDKAQHYIYIENQFFISGMNSNNVVGNRILQQLVNRIHRAVRENKVFRVYVLMPLLPAFEGNIRSEELTNLHAVMHWQFATICRGRHCLFSALREFTDKPEAYVAFFGLRNYGIMPNGCVSTEQVYIHSKLLIADDRYVILGSANINDRSMLGYRDSEIAVVIEDTEFMDGYMDQQLFKRGVAASALRMQLFREHLGLCKDESMTEDPVSELSWQQIKHISRQNTAIFERVFNCAPSNEMRSFTSFQNIEITQIYENQRLNMMKGRKRQAWDASHLKEGDYAPWTDVNGVPIPLDRLNLTEFEVDTRKDRGRKKLFSMDNDGWCYARNFSVFQEVRTGSSDYRKREKLQHFMTDRLIAQVRRRRWVRRGSAAAHALSIILVDSADDEELHGFRALWRKRKDSFIHRAHSFAGSLNIALGTHGLHSQTEIGTPKSAVSAYHSSNAPGFHDHKATSDSYHRYNGRLSVPLPPTTLATVSLDRLEADTVSLSKRRQSVEQMSRQLSVSIKKFLDHPVDFGRRSRFAAEYFDAHGDNEDEGSDSGRSSWMSVQTPGDVAQLAHSASQETPKDDCQMKHVQTSAMVPKDVEKRARGMLCDIQGHLVDFPLDFLVEEMLKPPIMPADIHI